MALVKFISGNKTKTVECPSGISITDAAASAGIALNAPCGGKGICGNCRVKAIGTLSTPSADELSLLGNTAKNGTRLACMTYIQGDCEISTQVGESTAPGVEHQKSINGISPRSAAAIDIGTTTVVIRLYSIPNGELLNSAVFRNPQCVRGADVVTRLEYCLNGGESELKALLDRAIQETLDTWGAKPEFTIVTGNTVMLHIAAGRDARGLALAPFEPETLFGFWEGDRYYMRCSSAYVGGDAVASLLASGIAEGNETAVLSDIGTNNETILFDGTKLFACSSSAGPAFEGAHISCGMPAVDGAITDVKITNGEVVLSTIGGKPPIGICGSGLINAADALYQNGYLAPDGSVIRPLPDFGGFKLTAQDISELQLAKSAVLAGISTLMHTAGNILDIKRFVPAGSFGVNVDLYAAERIGMIPIGFADIADEKPVNAVDGAAMLLLDERNIKKSEQLAEGINTVELADSTFFADSFISNLYFPT